MTLAPTHPRSIRMAALLLLYQIDLRGDADAPAIQEAAISVAAGAAADDDADSADLAAYREALSHLSASQRLLELAPDRAIEEIERAAALQPNMPEPQRLLGDARKKRGDVEGARRAYRRFLELSPPYLKDVEEVKGLLGTI